MAERNSQGSLKNIRLERLVYQKAGFATLEHDKIARPKPGQVLLKSLYSGISRGTESLVFKGRVPKKAWQTMKCPNQIGTFNFPISYGYQLVAEAIEVDKNVTGIESGDTFFLLHPHQSFVVIDHKALNKVPKYVSPRRAVLAANMETALNTVWDSEIKQGKRAAILGAGVVGLLIASISQKITQNPVLVIDQDARKQAICEKLGLEFAHPDDVNEDFEFIFNATASPAALQFAINHSSFEATIVEASWYGDKEVTLNLGDRFHSNRLKIISSQVGHVSPLKRGEIDHAGRMQHALSELEDKKYDCLLEPDIKFRDIPNELSRIFDPDKPILCQVIKYQE